MATLSISTTRDAAMDERGGQRGRIEVRLWIRHGPRRPGPGTAITRSSSLAPSLAAAAARRRTRQISMQTRRDRRALAVRPGATCRTTAISKVAAPIDRLQTRMLKGGML